jgi:inorganic pyrophosphatase
LEPGQDPPREVNAVIEIPKGSNIKYEINVNTKAIKVDRFLRVAMAYPGNYGFIPCTKSEDGDALDVLVLGNDPLVVGCVVAVNPIGVLMTKDQDGNDEKIIAKVSSKVDPCSADINDIEDIREPIRSMIEHFIEHHKDMEVGKYVKIIRWGNREEAWKTIRDAIERHAGRKL